MYTVDPQEDSTAGYHFEVDSKYVVFARYRKLQANGDSEEIENSLWTELCSQNVNLESFENKNSLVRKLAYLKSKLEISETTTENAETLDQDTKASESSELTDPNKRQEALN